MQSQPAVWHTVSLFAEHCKCTTRHDHISVSSYIILCAWMSQCDCGQHERMHYYSCQSESRFITSIQLYSLRPGIDDVMGYVLVKLS
jgi:hypothetical protein